MYIHNPESGKIYSRKSEKPEINLLSGFLGAKGASFKRNVTTFQFPG